MSLHYKYPGHQSRVNLLSFQADDRLKLQQAGCAAIFEPDSLYHKGDACNPAPHTHHGHHHNRVLRLTHPASWI